MLQSVRSTLLFEDILCLLHSCEVLEASHIHHGLELTDFRRCAQQPACFLWVLSVKSPRQPPAAEDTGPWWWLQVRHQVGSLHCQAQGEKLTGYSLLL